jgi:hypothetical protein
LNFALALIGTSGSYALDFPILSLFVIAGFGLPRLLLDRPMPSHGTPLWIILPFAPTLTSTRRFLRRMAAAWQHGPVTWVTSPQAAPFSYGAHAYLADRLGRLKALFPALTIECADWHRVLPLATAWEALPVRELYPASKLMTDAIATLLPADARVVVLIGAELNKRPSTIKLTELATTLRHMVPLAHTHVLSPPEMDATEAEVAFPGLVHKLKRAWSKREAKEFLDTLSRPGAPIHAADVPSGEEPRPVISTGGVSTWLPKLTWPLSKATLVWTIAAAVFTAWYSVRISETRVVKGVSPQQLAELRQKTESALKSAEAAVASVNEVTAEVQSTQSESKIAERCCNEVDAKVDKIFNIPMLK